MRAATGLGLIIIATMIACGSTHTSGEAGLGDGDPTGEGTNVEGTDPRDAKAPALVSNLEVTGVAVFQAVKVDVVKSGALVAKNKRNAPIVANRSGMLRVYVKPGADWEPREVTAEVRLVDGETSLPVLRETKKISGASKDEDLKSTFNIELPADDLPVGVTFQVALTADDGEAVAEGEESGARFPLDGSFEDLGAQISGKVKVVVVPIKYEADGSGRTPDVSAGQLELYRETLLRLYPTSEVEMSTRKVYAWDTTVAQNGQGWGNVLQAMYDLRRSDRVDDDVYYYGVFSPATSMAAFCQQGCVAGLSTVPDEDTAMLRASIGLGFKGQDAADTMAHELGHAHGREHSPCGGADNTDPRYPYDDAEIGVWGYDLSAKTLISPTKGRDVMAYCPNIWISDYTYRKLFERITTVASQKKVVNPAASTDEGSSWQMATVGVDGSLSWTGGKVDYTSSLKGGSRVSARFLAESGAVIGTRDARFYKFDHIAGGILFVPREASLAWKSIKVDGFRQALVR